jgi:HSP20 family protein
MFGVTRWSPFDDMFRFQREVDRLFNQFWSDLPTRTAGVAPGTFHVNSDDQGWRINVPLPGIAPEHVSIDVAGNSVTIRAEVPSEDRDPARYEQSLTLPPFLDVEKLTAAHRHGMLQLSVPLKETLKPRRIEIQTTTDDRKQLTSA